MSIWRSSKDTRQPDEPISRLLRSVGPSAAPAHSLEVTDIPPAAPPAPAWSGHPDSTESEPPPHGYAQRTPPPGEPQPDVYAFGGAPSTAAPVVIPPPPINAPQYRTAPAPPSGDAWAHTEDLARSIVSLADVRAGLRATPAEVLAMRVLDAVDAELRAVGRYLAEQIGTGPAPGATQTPAVQEALARVDWLVAALEQPGNHNAALAGVRRALDAIRAAGAR